MNNGGDAAEQVVRLSLEGFEVAAKLTGSAAKNVALLLVSVLKQEQQTKGKARLTNMIKSGKELKVFSIPNKDLAQFTEQAKRYGVLYCVLRDKSAKGDDVPRGCYRPCRGRFQNPAHRGTFRDRQSR